MVDLGCKAVDGIAVDCGMICSEGESSTLVGGGGGVGKHPGQEAFAAASLSVDIHRDEEFLAACHG